LITLSAIDGAIWRISLPGDVLLEEASDAGADPILAKAAKQLLEYFAGECQTFDFPMQAQGSAFQQRVWTALGQIPFGTTRSYGEVAKVIGKPTASRAVGAANGKNPLAIVVPCHRVIGANGMLTGYAGGLDIKKWLLDFEAKILIG
jgi:methylated-DNA-[protein]-cysteine S-methyltransferase